MASYVLYILLALQAVSGSDHYRNGGFMDHLNNGIKLAQNLLGSESVGLKVADLVVRAFQTVNSPNKNNKRPLPLESPGDDLPGSEEQLHEETRPNDLYDVPTPSPLRYLVRLLGLNPSQISAVAVNALVFVAQMITTFLVGPKRPISPYRSDDPTDWILNKNSEKLQELITTAKNESLTELVEELIKQHDNEEDTSCIRLLVCKITPFVSKMQQAVFGNEKTNLNNFSKEGRGAAIMYHHLPSKEEIEDRSNVCEKRFRECDLNE